MRERLSRPIWTERCSSRGSRSEGGFGGNGGISCSASRGEIGAGGVGVETCRYHGMESEAVDVGGSDAEGTGPLASSGGSSVLRAAGWTLVWFRKNVLA